MFEAILSTLKAVFLAVPLTWYPADPPETPEQFKARKLMVAEQSAKAATAYRWSFPAADMAALIGVIMIYESALEYQVHAGGESLLGNQDSAKARCLGQIHQNGRTVEEWRALAGLDPEATFRCAAAIAGAMEYHVKRCKLFTDQGRMTAVQANILFYRYGTGNGPCSTAKRSRKREARWEKMRWNIEQWAKKLRPPKKRKLETFVPERLKSPTTQRD